MVLKQLREEQAQEEQAEAQSWKPVGRNPNGEYDLR